MWEALDYVLKLVAEPYHVCRYGDKCLLCDLLVGDPSLEPPTFCM